MSDGTRNFQTIKRKYFIAAIIAGAALGVFAGVGLTCVLAVVLKRCAVNLFWAIYLPIGLVLSAAFSALFFFILKPNDLRIAKKLDGEYALKQKVQTMVENSAATDAMSQLQRVQADESLGEAAKRRIDLKWLLKFAFVPVLAVAMLFVGIFVPARKGAEKDPVINITDAQAASLSNLIAEVNGSDLTPVVKEGTATVLGELLAGLKEGKPQSVVRASVISSVALIDTLVASSNSYLKIFNVLSKDAELKSFAVATAKGVIYFRSGDTKYTNMNIVTARAETAESSITGALNKWRDEYLKGFVGGSSGNTPISVADASDKIKAFSKALKKALKDEALKDYYPSEEGGEAAVADDFYVKVAYLSATFETLSEAEGITNPATYYDGIEASCDRFVTDGARALCPQSYSCLMDEYIRTALSKIFNISVREFGVNITIPQDSQLLDEVINENPDNPPDWVPDGGSEYGSDDMILNVNTGKAEEYGNLLQEYKKRIDDYIREGICADELAAYVNKYFRLLASGLEDK